MATTTAWHAVDGKVLWTSKTMPFQFYFFFENKPGNDAIFEFLPSFWKNCPTIRTNPVHLVWQFQAVHFWFFHKGFLSYDRTGYPASSWFNRSNRSILFSFQNYGANYFHRFTCKCTYILDTKMYPTTMNQLIYPNSFTKIREPLLVIFHCTRASMQWLLLIWHYIESYRALLPGNNLINTRPSLVHVIKIQQSFMLVVHYLTRTTFHFYMQALG